MKRLITVAIGVAALVGNAYAAERYVDLGVNDKLAEMGLNVRLAYAEFIVPEGSDFTPMKLVFFKDVGNKQLVSDWVPGDPRRGGFTDITYLTDLVDGIANDGGAGIDAGTTTAVIEEGMMHWNGIECSSIPLTGFGGVGIDLGLVEFLVGFGGFPGWFTDITHAGWLPGAFFDAIGGPGGADNILGVTFTFWWTDGGVPTDVNGDGKNDTALAEIYMNNNFEWELGNSQGTGVYDIKAVMFHEQRHALSQGHFGEISLNPRGQLIISPKNGDNVMLAAISSNWVWEGFHGSDIGGHCSIWADWPLQ